MVSFPLLNIKSHAVILAFAILGISLNSTPLSYASQSCSQLGQLKTIGSQTLICVNKLGEKIWIILDKKNTRKFVSAKNRVEEVTFGGCRAYVPTGWKYLSDENAYSGELFSPSGKSYAGWYLRAVNIFQQEVNPVYGIPADLDNPNHVIQAEASMKYIADKLNLDSNFQPSGKTFRNGGYVAVRFKSSTSKAYLIYPESPFPGDGLNFQYVNSVRISIVPGKASEDDLLATTRSALSIRCSSKLSINNENLFQVKARKGSQAKESISESEFNSQLGSGWARDPDTGELYGLSLNMHSTNACGTGIGGVQKVVGNTCKVIDWGN